MKKFEKCPQCDSNQLISGTLYGHMGGVALFRPDNLKFLTLSTDLGVEKHSYVCVDCGLVLSSTDQNKAKNLIIKSGKQPIKDKLNL